ncbi:MAG: transporter substrate-binding domain-containing protein [Bdellovibrionales bacterium]|jgi:ABC-type amino acid transport substrate-binding protein
MKNHSAIWTILIAVVIALGVQNLLLRPSPSTTAASKESTLDHVMRTKKMRCAYWIWPSLIERNPNTGAMSGAFVDIINKVGEALGAEIVWQQEASFDDFGSLANSDKVDAVCGPLIPGPFLRPLAHFAAPVLYASFDIYVRPKDNRFNASRDILNKPDTSILSLDGSAARYFATTLFPQAHHNSLPAILGAGQVLMDVKNGKDDATVSEQLTATRFLDYNPNSLKKVSWDNKPLITLGLTLFGTKVDDIVWANTLDKIISDLLDFGVVEQILTKNGLIAGKHYQAIARPYQDERKEIR